jgi:hypothetical protein
MDPDRSYAGIGNLLQEFINHSRYEAWEKITTKIDYTYENLDLALAPLASATDLTREITSRIAKGQKLFFKPNLVIPHNIDPETHGPASGSTTCTEWPFMAALMRWFHDKLGISYHQMALGEAASAIPSMAMQYSMLYPNTKPVTPEAIIEGRSGDLFVGWGFYFVRKYLAECLESHRIDDPMRGYEESVAATYIPPGYVTDKLIVYDLNRIFDDPTKGRDVEVPDGVNFDSITLHKVVVGGDPDDAEDLRAYPPCILINVPKFKVHSIAMFTNVIKNLGIGLYPMQATETDHPTWKYSVPHGHPPGVKATIPHQVWAPETDTQSGLPLRDAKGNYIVAKTGGITATMIDIIQAVKSQGVFMLHVVDGIEAINLDHSGRLPGTKVPEGMVFAGLDPVATDLLCARYMFNNVPIKESMGSNLDDGNGGRFPQCVPIPGIEESQIVTQSGYDCPLSRDICFAKAEERGLGVREYHVVGRDAVTDRPVVSLQGHLGTIHHGRFSDLVTETLYFDVFKMPWDLQRTVLQYFEAVDKLAGSSLKHQFLDTFDETGDGMITYEEFGKNGILGPGLHIGGKTRFKAANEPYGSLHGQFGMMAAMFKYTNPSWNAQGHDLLREYYWGRACLTAYRMSKMEVEAQDLFQPGLKWGQGKWPSFQLAWHVYLGSSLYGAAFPDHIGFPSLYGCAFRYADLTQNQGKYVGRIRNQPDPDAMNQYVSGVLSGGIQSMDFTLYVPEGYTSIGGTTVPNVEVTGDPGKILTASFSGGREVW